MRSTYGRRNGRHMPASAVSFCWYPEIAIMSKLTLSKYGNDAMRSSSGAFALLFPESF